MTINDVTTLFTGGDSVAKVVGDFTKAISRLEKIEELKKTDAADIGAEIEELAGKLSKAKAEAALAAKVKDNFKTLLGV
jgi:hypothetical protein